jgi:hypothetical protein
MPVIVSFTILETINFAHDKYFVRWYPVQAVCIEQVVLLSSGVGSTKMMKFRHLDECLEFVEELHEFV